MLLSPSNRTKFLADLDPNRLHHLERKWDVLAHRHQRPPSIDAPWLTWLLLGGRGAGKTRAGAEWVTAQALGLPPFAEREHRHIAIIGEDAHDVREIMIEGISGLSRVNPYWPAPCWMQQRKRFEWPNGSVASAFSADDPDSLRGPQFEAAWLDELAKWRHAEATFDMLQFGLRLGERPRQVITTTPRPIPLLKKLIADPRTAVTRATTHDNARFLAPAFVDTILQRYQGTRLGRQEILGELIEDRPDALWPRALIEAARVNAAPQLARIVVAVDPPASSSKGADACGLVAAGRAENGLIYVIADESASGLSPAQWAAKAIALWRRLSADALVVEVNQGGDMVRAVISEQDRTVPVTAVHAKRGKWLRAEPVAALYEQGKVKHAGSFPELEDEMCDFGLDGLSSGCSPDRLDALVWAVTHLSFGAGQGPRIRTL
ncbi:MAG: terminase family protein [Pseudorhodoplanes sp.]|jgi:phage terminase large subunit-like protein|nr:terminase family protein [Pseudorhodoplanes sp.]